MIYSSPFASDAELDSIYQNEKAKGAGSFVGGLKSGIYDTIGSTEATLGALGRVVGADTLAQTLERRAAMNSAQAAGASAAAPASLSEIHGPGDAVSWAANLAGQQIPMLGSLILAGGLGGIGGAALQSRKGLMKLAGTAAAELADSTAAARGLSEQAAKAFRERAVKSAVETAANRNKLALAVEHGLRGTTPGAKIGRAVGTAASFFPITAGQVYQELLADPNAQGSEKEKALGALLAGAGMTTVGTVLDPTHAIQKAMAVGARRELAAKFGAEAALATDSHLRNIGATMLGQGAVGAGMNLISQLTQGSFDPNKSLSPLELGENALVGALVGAGISSVPAAVSMVKELRAKAAYIKATTAHPASPGVEAPRAEPTTTAPVSLTPALYSDVVNRAIKEGATPEQLNQLLQRLAEMSNAHLRAIEDARLTTEQVAGHAELASDAHNAMNLLLTYPSMVEFLNRQNAMRRDITRIAADAIHAGKEGRARVEEELHRLLVESVKPATPVVPIALPAPRTRFEPVDLPAEVTADPAKPAYEYRNPETNQSILIEELTEPGFFQVRATDGQASTLSVLSRQQLDELTQQHGNFEGWDSTVHEIQPTGLAPPAAAPTEVPPEVLKARLDLLQRHNEVLDKLHADTEAASNVLDVSMTSARLDEIANSLADNPPRSATDPDFQSWAEAINRVHAIGKSLEQRMAEVTSSPESIARDLELVPPEQRTLDHYKVAERNFQRWTDNALTGEHDLLKLGRLHGKLLDTAQLLMSGGDLENVPEKQAVLSNIIGMAQHVDDAIAQIRATEPELTPEETEPTGESDIFPQGDRVAPDITPEMAANLEQASRGLSNGASPLPIAGVTERHLTTRDGLSYITFLPYKDAPDYLRLYLPTFESLAKGAPVIYRGEAFHSPDITRMFLKALNDKQPIKHTDVVKMADMSWLLNRKRLQVTPTADALPYMTASNSNEVINADEEYVIEHNGDKTATIYDNNYPKYRLTVPSTLSGLVSDPIVYRDKELRGTAIRRVLAEAARNRVPVDARRLIELADHDYAFTSIPRQRRVYNYDPKTGLDIRDEVITHRPGPLTAAYGIESVKIKTKDLSYYNNLFRRAVYDMHNQGYVLVGSMDNQLFFAKPEQRDEFYRDFDLHATIEGNIGAMERAGTLIKRESGDKRTYDVTHITKTHTEAEHDGVMGIVGNADLCQGVAINPVYDDARNITHYQIDKGIWRSPLERFTYTVDDEGKVQINDKIRSERESLNENLQFGHQRGWDQHLARRDELEQILQKVAELKSKLKTAKPNERAKIEKELRSIKAPKIRRQRISVYEMFPVARQQRGKINLQQIVFSAIDPVGALAKDRMERLQQLARGDFISPSQEELIKYGIAPNIFVKPRSALKWNSRIKGATSRAYVFSSPELLGELANEPVDPRLGEEFRRIMRRDYRPGYDDFLLAPGTYNEINEQWRATHNGENLKPGDMLILHRDPALPDASSQSIHVFRGIAKLQFGRGSHQRGIIVHPKSEGWTTAAGDFDGDSGVLTVPTDEILPAVRRQYPAYDVDLMKRGDARQTPVINILKDIVAKYNQLSDIAKTKSGVNMYAQYELVWPKGTPVTQAKIRVVKYERDRAGVFAPTEIKLYDALSSAAAYKASGFNQMINQIIAKMMDIGEFGALNDAIRLNEFDPSTGEYVKDKLHDVPSAVLGSTLSQTSVSGKKKAYWEDEAFAHMQRLEEFHNKVIANTVLRDPKTGEEQFVTSFGKLVPASQVKLGDNGKFYAGKYVVKPFITGSFSSAFRRVQRAPRHNSRLYHILRKQQKPWQRYKANESQVGYTGIPVSDREVWHQIVTDAETVLSSRSEAVLHSLDEIIASGIVPTNPEEDAYLKRVDAWITRHIPEDYAESDPDGRQAAIRNLSKNMSLDLSYKLEKFLLSLRDAFHQHSDPNASQLADDIYNTRSYVFDSPIHTELARRAIEQNRIYNDLDFFSSSAFNEDLKLAAKRQLQADQSMTPEKTRLFDTWNDALEIIQEQRATLEPEDSMHDFLDRAASEINNEMTIAYLTGHITAPELIEYGSPYTAAGILAQHGLADLKRLAFTIDLHAPKRTQLIAKRRDNPHSLRAHDLPTVGLYKINPSTHAMSLVEGVQPGDYNKEITLHTFDKPLHNQPASTLADILNRRDEDGHIVIEITSSTPNSISVVLHPGSDWAMIKEKQGRFSRAQYVYGKAAAIILDNNKFRDYRLNVTNAELLRQSNFVVGDQQTLLPVFVSAKGRTEPATWAKPYVEGKTVDEIIAEGKQPELFMVENGDGTHNYFMILSAKKAPAKAGSTTPYNFEVEFIGRSEDEAKSYLNKLIDPSLDETGEGGTGEGGTGEGGTGEGGTGEGGTGEGGTGEGGTGNGNPPPPPTPRGELHEVISGSLAARYNDDPHFYRVDNHEAVAAIADTTNKFVGYSLADSWVDLPKIALTDIFSDEFYYDYEPTDRVFVALSTNRDGYSSIFKLVKTPDKLAMDRKKYETFRELDKVTNAGATVVTRRTDVSHPYPADVDAAKYLISRGYSVEHRLNMDVWTPSARDPKWSAFPLLRLNKAQIDLLDSLNANPIPDATNIAREIDTLVESPVPTRVISPLEWYRINLNRINDLVAEGTNEEQLRRLADSTNSTIRKFLNNALGCSYGVCHGLYNYGNIEENLITIATGVHRTKNQIVGTFFHELGHHIVRTAWRRLENTQPEVATAILKEYADWLHTHTINGKPIDASYHTIDEWLADIAGWHIANAYSDEALKNSWIHTLATQFLKAYDIISGRLRRVWGEDGTKLEFHNTEGWIKSMLARAHEERAEDIDEQSRRVHDPYGPPDDPGEPPPYDPTDPGPDPYGYGGTPPWDDLPGSNSMDYSRSKAVEGSTMHIDDITNGVPIEELQHVADYYQASSTRNTLPPVKITTSVEMQEILRKDNSPQAQEALRLLQEHAEGREGVNGLHFVNEAGNHFILVSGKDLTPVQQAAVFSHEYAHVIISARWDELASLYPNEARVVANSYLFEAKHIKRWNESPEKVQTLLSGNVSTPENANMQRDFREWLADQVGIWLNSDEAPRVTTFVSKWFKEIKKQLIQVILSAVRSVFPRSSYARGTVNEVHMNLVKMLDNVFNHKRARYARLLYQENTGRVRLPDFLKQKSAALKQAAVTNQDTISAIKENIDFIRTGLRGGDPLFMSLSDRRLLERIVSQPEMKKRMMELLGHDSEAAKAVSTNLESAVAYFYALTSMGVLKPSGEEASLFTTLRDIVTHHNRQFIEATNQDLDEITKKFLGADVEITSENKIPMDSPAARLYGEISQRYASGAFGAAQRVAQQYKRFFTAYIDVPAERLLNTGNPALIRLVQETQPMAWDIFGYKPHGSMERARVLYQLYAGRAGEILKDVTDAEGVMFTAHMFGAARKVPAHIENAAKETNILLQNIYNYSNPVTNLSWRGADYYPMMVDWTKVKDNMEETLNLYCLPCFREGWKYVQERYVEWIKSNCAGPLREKGIGGGLDTTKIEEAIAKIENMDLPDFVEFYLERSETDTLPGNVLRQLPVGSIHTPSFRFMNPRILSFLLENAPTNDIKLRVVQTLITDPKRVLPEYIRSAVKRTEYQRAMNKLGGMQQIFAEAEARGATQEQLALATTYMDALHNMLGIKERDFIDEFLEKNFSSNSWLRKTFSSGGNKLINPNIQRINSAVTTWLNISHLTLAFASSSVDVFGSLVRSNANFPLFFKSLRSSLQYLARDKNPTKVRAMFRAVQAIGTLQNMFVHDDLVSSYANPNLDPAFQKILNLTFTLNGVKYMTEMSRCVATFMGMHAIHDWTVDALKGSASARQELYRLGLTPEDVTLVAEDGVPRILDWQERLAATSEEVDKDNLVRAAIHRFVDESNVRPDSATRPFHVSNPYYSIVTLWQGYVSTFDNQILRPAFAKAYEDGNFLPLAVLLSVYPVTMFFADMLRDAIKEAFDGDDQFIGDRPAWKKGWTWGDHLAYSLERSGLYGRHQKVLEILRPIMQGDPVKGVAQIGSVATSDLLKYNRWGTVPLPGKDLWNDWRIADKPKKASDRPFEPIHS